MIKCPGWVDSNTPPRDSKKAGYPELLGVKTQATVRIPDWRIQGSPPHLRRKTPIFELIQLKKILSKETLFDYTQCTNHTTLLQPD